VIRLFMSLLLVLVAWYVARVIVNAPDTPLARVVDLAAFVFVFLLALRYFGLV